jgi:hypothetical protein
VASDFYGIEPSDVLAAAAIVVSFFLFYFGQKRSKKSETINMLDERIEAMEQGKSTDGVF